MKTYLSVNIANTHYNTLVYTQ